MPILTVMAWQRGINDFVIDGVVDRYILANYSSRKLGMQTTGNAGGVHNLDIIAPPAKSCPVAQANAHWPVSHRIDGLRV